MVHVVTSIKLSGKLTFNNKGIYNSLTLFLFLKYLLYSLDSKNKTFMNRGSDYRLRLPLIQIQ